MFDSLTSLKGLVLDNRYELHSLYDVGGQSVVFLARTDHDDQVVVKMARQPYHRPAYISTENIREGRARLEREGELLKEFTGSLLPEFYDFIYAPNPLHSAARGDEIAEKEPYLVMEFIEGRTILDIARQAHLSDPSDYRTIEWLSWESVIAVASFLAAISDEAHGYLYSDINPVNLMLNNDQERPIRILDAGSLVPFQPSPLIAPFTPVFVRPDYYEAYREGRPLWPTVSSVMYSLGKMLWAILTNRHPHPGIEPDMSNGVLRNYSSRLPELIVDMLKMRFESFQKLKDAFEIASTSIDRSSIKPAQIDSPVDKSELETRSTLGVGRTSSSTKITKVAQVSVRRVSVLRYSADGSCLAAATNRSIELLNSGTLKSLGSFKFTQNTPMRSLDFDSSGRYLASGSRGKICVWEIDRVGPVWQYFDEHLNGRIALGCNGDIVVAVTKWNALILAVNELSNLVRYFPGVAEPCNCVSWAEKQLTLAVGGFGGACIYHVEVDQKGATHRPKPDHILRTREIARFIALDDNAATLSMVTSRIQEPTVYSLAVFRLPNLEPSTQVRLPFRTISTVIWESKGRFVFIGDPEGVLAVWDQENGQEYARLSLSGPITSLNIARDGKTIAASTASGKVHICEFG